MGGNANTAAEPDAGGIWPYGWLRYDISMASPRVSSSNWLEHRTPNPRVAGSNPAWPAIILAYDYFANYLAKVLEINDYYG